MTNKLRVSILGCGWFGLPLAKLLVKAGHQVKGSTTSQSKLPDLVQNGIDAYLLNLNEESPEPGENEFFNSELLIIGIPPKMRNGNGGDYPGKIRRVADGLVDTEVKHVLFVSSISVFADSNSILNEQTPPFPDSPSGKAILEAEQLLLGKAAFDTTVLRFSGLIGPGRDPGRFFAGKTGIPNGQAPVNLIHLEDCLGITQAIIEKNAYGHIFHGVSPQHPSKSDFYGRAAAVSGLPAPDFVDELLSWKIIESLNVPKFLNYAFKRDISL